MKATEFPDRIWEAYRESAARASGLDFSDRKVQRIEWKAGGVRRRAAVNERLPSEPLNVEAIFEILSRGPAAAIAFVVCTPSERGQGDLPRVNLLEIRERELVAVDGRPLAA